MERSDRNNSQLGTATTKVTDNHKGNVNFGKQETLENNHNKRHLNFEESQHHVPVLPCQTK